MLIIPKKPIAKFHCVVSYQAGRGHASGEWVVQKVLPRRATGFVQTPKPWVFLGTEDGSYDGKPRVGLIDKEPKT